MSSGHGTWRMHPSLISQGTRHSRSDRTTRQASHVEPAMKVAFVAIGALAILATLLPFIRSDRWWIRIFDYPRQQIAFVIAATLVILILLGDGNSIGKVVFLAALLLAFTCQAAQIFPYTPLARRQVLRAD